MKSKRELICPPLAVFTVSMVSIFSFEMRIYGGMFMFTLMALILHVVKSCNNIPVIFH